MSREGCRIDCLWRLLPSLLSIQNSPPPLALPPRPPHTRAHARTSQWSLHAWSMLTADQGRRPRSAEHDCQFLQKTRRLRDFQGASFQKRPFKSRRTSFLQSESSPCARRIWLKQSSSLGAPGPSHSEVSVSGHLYANCQDQRTIGEGGEFQ